MLKIAIQGYKASFHHIAANNYFGSDRIEIMPCDTFRQVAAADEALKLAQKTKDRAINQIKARMQSAQNGSCTGWRCSWKTQERRTLNMDALREDFPDIPFENYMKVSKSRPFKWSAVEQ